MRTLLRFILRMLFGFRAFNKEVLNTPGPVLLLPNHTSWFDWLFLSAYLDDKWKFVTSKQAAQVSPLHRFIMINKLTFPVETESPYAVKHMAEYLQNGGKLVIFPEGRLSRTGSLMKLFDGTGFLLFKTNATAITCYLRGAQHLPSSPNPNQRKWFPRVSAHFSELTTAPKLGDVSTSVAREKLTRWLYDTMIAQQFQVELALSPGNVLEAVRQSARKQPGSVAVQDAGYNSLTYRKLLAGVNVMAAQWRGRLGEGERVGILLPTTAAFPVTLLSLWANSKAPAIFNFSSGIPTMLACANIAGVKQIVTSKLFLEKAKLNVQAMQDGGIEFIFLEDIKAKVGFLAKSAGYLGTFFPGKPLPDNRKATAVILFTSGSEGVPKAVELSHGNLMSNIRQMLGVMDLTDKDRIFNPLPLFHSFGLTVGLLLPLVRGVYAFLYPSPLHYRVIPALFYDLDCTVFFGTNTFLNGYARKASPYDFRSLRYLFAAAEKLQEATANTWARRFGVRILEGYGATECSPCVTVNSLVNPNFGSVGRFMPGMEYKIETVEGVAEGGRLWVRGPNIMKGYSNPEANAKFLESGGWYDTGDIARVDADGYVYILGRLKRFAKVSGEMVSLTAVEEALAGAFPQYGLRCQIAILALPDPGRGEMLLAVTNEPKLQMDEIRAVLKAKGLSNLSVPREVKAVKSIPMLGTGKTNHRELQKMIE